MFDHPYLAMYRRLHEEFGLKVQLNLFYRMESFDLSQVSDAYYEEWKENSDWLKLSFLFFLSMAIKAAFMRT